MAWFIISVRTYGLKTCNCFAGKAVKKAEKAVPTLKYCTCKTTSAWKKKDIIIKKFIPKYARGLNLGREKPFNMIILVIAGVSKPISRLSNNR